jgi:hypothetical protein
MVQEPTPELEPNPEPKVRFLEVTDFLKPADLEGLGVLTIRYVSPDKDDDQYMYVPSMRRVRRMSTAQRQDSAGGTDHCWDDYRGWMGHIPRNEYKFLGVTEILGSSHNEIVSKEKWHTEVNQAYPYGTLRHRCKAYMVEVVSKEPNYMYSKRIWYVDPESFAILDTDMYDRHGRLWKKFDNNLFIVKGAIFNSGGYSWDMQRLHSTIWYTPNMEPYSNYDVNKATVEQLSRRH